MSGRKTETLTTDENVYQCTQLGALDGREALLRVQQIVGKGQTRGLAGIIGEMTAKDLSYFCDLFAAQTTLVAGEKRQSLKGIFDSHFAGEYFEMTEWLAFCLGLNFGPFFRQLDQKGDRILLAAGWTQPTQTESTGAVLTGSSGAF